MHTVFRVHSFFQKNGISTKKFHYVDWEDPPLTVITGIMSELFGGNNELTSDADIVTP